MRRRTFDWLMSTGGIVMTVFLVVAGVLLFAGYKFADNPWIRTFASSLNAAWKQDWKGAPLSDIPMLKGVDKFGPTGQISDSRWHWGWTAGGGVEVKLNKDWSAKLEYLYVGLQDKSYFNPAPSAGFQVSAGLGYQAG